MFLRNLLFILCLLLGTVAQAKTLTTKQSALQFTLKQESSSLRSMYGRVAAKRALALYESLNFQPLWQDKLFKNPSKGLIALLNQSSNDGLTPARYYPEVLEDLAERYADTKSMVHLTKKDVYNTTALLRFLADINEGQSSPDIYVHRHLRTDKAAKDANITNLFMRTLASNNMVVASRGEKLQHPEYLALRTALTDYRERAEAGEVWPIIPFTRKKFSVGSTDTRRVPLLMKRLEAEGYLPTDNVPTATINEEISAAVAEFQARHGLKADGVMGPATLRAINTPMDVRIDQLRLALERWRWLPNDLGDKHLRVNIAGFQLRAFDKQQEVLTMPIIVGKKKNATPMMQTVATDVTFNPYWYIPESILQSKVIPKLRENPSSFYRKNYEASIGSYRAEAITDVSYVLAAATAVGDTNEYNADVLRLRQRPGRGNALGRARVNILNNEAIYLHDTPYKSAFKREYRALSHGCIRLSDPQAVVDFLLAEHSVWQPEQTEELFNIKNPQKPSYVTLDAQIPVYLLYSTAWAQNGKIHFGQDVYNYDAPLLASLNQSQENRIARR